MSRVNGHTLHLSKHRTSRNEADAPDAYAYSMWGYYDYLHISSVSGWSGLDPSLQNKGVIHEEFPIKLVEPLEGDFADKGHAYFEYDDLSDIAKADAFIVVAVLQFSKNAMKYLLHRDKKSGASYALLNKHIQEQILACKIHHVETNETVNVDSVMSSLHCSTYYSIGFCDMVAIFRTNHIDYASDIITQLRTAYIPTENESEKDFLLSTSYMMCGVKDNYVPVCDSAEYEILRKSMKNIRFSIRLLLKPGISPHQLYEKIRTMVIERHQKAEPSLAERLPALGALRNESTVENAQGDVVSTVMRHGNLLSQTYGNSDVLILPNFMPLVLLHEYMSQEGVLNPVGEFFKKNILSIRSSIRYIPCADIAPDDCVMREKIAQAVQLSHKQQLDNMLDEIDGVMGSVKAYYEAKHTYMKRKQDTIMPITQRLINGLSQTLELFLDLNRLSHTFAIRIALKPVLTSFRQNIDNALKKFTKMVDKNVPDYKIYDFIMKTDFNVDEFRHELNELLLDYIRSDRQYIEGRTLLHFAVGSATKLLLAYSRLIRGLSEIVRNRAIDGESTYAFLLTSGGVSEMIACPFFNHIDPVLETNKIIEYCLLQIKIPERILYRPGISIYLLCHEMMHFVGARAREFRFMKIMESVYASTVNILGDLYEGWEPVIAYSLSDISDTTLREKLLTFAKDNLRERREIFQNELFSRLKGALIAHKYEDRFSNGKMQLLLSEHLGNVIYSLVCDNFVARYRVDRNGLPGQVCEHFWKDMGAFWGAVRAAYDGYKCASNIIPVNLQIKEAVFYATEGMPDLVAVHFDKILGYKYVAISEQEASLSARLPSKKAEQERRPFFQNLQTTIDQYITVFQEVFVDTTTCLYLDCPIETFLGVFLHANESPILAFPLVPEVILRFGTVLCLREKAIMTIMDLQSEEEFCEKLRDIFSPYKSSILSAKICSVPVTATATAEDTTREVLESKVTIYLDHIMEILKIYRTSYYQTNICRPLLEYATHCEEIHQEAIKHLDKDKRDFLDKIRELLKNDLVEARDESKEVLSWAYLLHFWMDSINEEC